MRTLALIVSGFLISVFVTGCQSARPVRVGFNAELSGRNATLGVQGRNGAMLAIEAVNNRGGVNGRPLQLVVRDNGSDPEKVYEIDLDFVNSGIFAITGHMTSWETTSAMRLLDSENAILISPTTSSPTFTSKRDHFFRLIPDNTFQAVPLAEMAFNKLGLRRVVIMHDEDNAAYAHPLVDSFVARFTSLGGERVFDQEFSSKDQPDFRPMLEGLRDRKPDLLLVVASSVDAAIITQHARMMGWDVPVFTTTWAATQDLITFGGKAVDGIHFVTHFDPSCGTPVYKGFRAEYLRAYGEEPTFPAVYSYESILVLADALKRTSGEWKGLPEALTQVKQLDGLCEQISLDEYGDVLRHMYIVVIREGKFQTVEIYQPEKP